VNAEEDRSRELRLGENNYAWPIGESLIPELKDVLSLLLEGRRPTKATFQGHFNKGESHT
jgi:hypothetical protein